MGTLKPKGGPRVRFVVETLIPGREFVDLSRLTGARLTFAHRVIATADQGCTEERTSTWADRWLVLEPDLRKGLSERAQADLERLARLAEAAQYSWA